MFSKPIKVVLLLVIVAGLSLVFAATGALAQNPTSKRPGVAWLNSTAGIVYTQPHNLSGVLLPSSWQEPNGNDADQYVWDNFTLQASTGITITEIQWRGGYQSGSGTVLTFTVAIYPSIAGGTQPDVTHPPLVQYQPGGNAGETPAGTFGGTAMYDYAFMLPAPFTASTGTTYWVQIEAWQAGVPDWGIAAGSGGNGQHFRRITNGSDIFYQLVPGDAAFTLIGPVTEVPISGLHAQNDGPTALGQTTTFAATVNAGSGISYAWDFGDQTTGNGQVVMHTYAAIGSYTAVVTATNSLGSVAATTPVTIDVPIAGLSAINNSPTLLGNVTSLTATIASGSNINYQWNFGNGALGHGKEVTYTYGTVGFYTAMVTATNSVSVVTATTPVTIFGATPLVNAGRDQTVTAGAEVTLDGSGSFAAPGHWPLTYFWQQLGGTQVVLNSYTISRPTFIAPAAPTNLTFTLVVTDAMALVSEPDQVQIDVMPKRYVYLPLIRRS
jgi:PKD repeat protein